MPTFTYINSDNQLNSLVEQYRQKTLLVLDTEFVRTRTYYARLGLIQAYDGETLALIDPLTIEDLTPFWQLLQQQDMTIVLHACSEDLDIFANASGLQPANLFDSQIAAALTGLGASLGYAKLTEQLLGVVLDKGESRTDWIKRPLTDRQLNYAANDVYYLYQLYPQLIEKLTELGRLSWVFEEGERLTKDRLLPLDGDKAYLKVKNAFQLNQKQLAYLKTLAKWRLQKALDRDLALGFVVKDHALIALAKKQPQTLSELQSMIELTEHEKRIHGKAIIKLLQETSLDILPAKIEVIALKSGYKPAFKAIKNSLLSIANDSGIPMELLGSKRYIHQYLNWLWADKEGSVPLLLTGWRGQLLAETLEKLEF